MEKLKLIHCVTAKAFNYDPISRKLTVPILRRDRSMETEALSLSMDTFLCRYAAEPGFAHKLICMLNDARRNKNVLVLLTPRDKYTLRPQYKLFYDAAYYEPFGKLAQEFTNITVHLITCAISGLYTYLVYDEFNKATSKIVRYYLIINQNKEIL